MTDVPARPAVTPAVTWASRVAHDPARDAHVAVRTAVRRFLERASVRCGCVAVACSGGSDSVALAAATVHCGRSAGLAVHGLVVDHGLQPGSAEVAATAARVLTGLGCASVRVLPVTVDGARNVEAAARAARSAALLAARPHQDALVLLGHTMDDQAETVLLGLGRGSGPRSIAGMRELDPPWGRPLLGVRRSVTRAACDGLPVWDDPHNADPRFRRARLRAEVLPLLEDVLAGGVTEALARTAAQLRDDNDALDALAATVLAASVPRSASEPDPEPEPALEPIPEPISEPDSEPDSASGAPGLVVDVLAGAPAAVRRRALRTWLLAAGVAELTDAHLRAVDDLVGRWHGQGGIALPGNLVARRARGRLLVVRRRADGEG